mgnify:CR=1 FL=1
MGMHPRRIPVPAGSLALGALVLPDEAAHYARHVLRLRAGTVITLFDGAGLRARATLLEGNNAEVAEILPAIETELPNVTLLVALSKGDKLDFIVEKATELGAHTLVPVVCARSVMQLKEERAAGRLERWNRVAQAAARQCGRDRVLTIAPVTPFLDAVHAPFDGEKRLCTLSRTPLSASLPDDVANVLIITGPEGGFDSAELVAARRAGCLEAGLGPLTLRAETAPLVALAVIMAHAGVM